MFIAGTLVHTGAGLKPVEALQPGIDLLLTFPKHEPRPRHRREQSEYSFRRLLRVTEIPNQEVVGLVFANLASGERELLLVSPTTGIFQLTPKTPQSREAQQWTHASCIGPGDGVENHLFGNLLVTESYPSGANRTTLFALEVKDTHTLYVGKTGVWVEDAQTLAVAA